MPSAPRLGVPLMDRDHAAIDLLFDAAATTADSELPALLDMIAEELHDHFAREEAAMIEARSLSFFIISNFTLSSCAKSKTCAGRSQDPTRLPRGS